MTVTWLIVANSAKARVFEIHGTHWHELSGLTHTASRLQGRELESDAPGRSLDSSRLGQRHAMNVQQTPHKHEEEIFALELADCLEKARTHNQVGRIFLTASPSLLGMLRKKISSETAKIIQGTCDKDLTLHEVEDIRKSLPFPL